MGVCKAFPRLIGRVAIVRERIEGGLRGQVVCVLGSEQRLCPSQRNHQKDLPSGVWLLWSWEDWVDETRRKFGPIENCSGNVPATESIRETAGGPGFVGGEEGAGLEGKGQHSQQILTIQQ